MKKQLLKFSMLSFLFVAPMMLSAQTTFFQEDFSSGSLPAGWTDVSVAGFADSIWLFNNPYGRDVQGAGFDANFAIFDSDDSSRNDGVDENAMLTTPSFSIAAATTSLYLVVDEQYQPLSGPNSGGSAHWIEASTDGGANWSNILYDSIAVGYPNPATRSIYNLAPYIGNSNLQIRFHWTGSWDWWWAIDNVLVTDQQPPCISPPTPGVATSSTNASCGSAPFTLDLISYSDGSGQTYQWQTSSDNINWTDLPGATTVPYATTQGSPTYYQCVVTCSGLSATSTSVFVDVNPIPGCYCYPHNDVCGGVDMITNVNFNGLDNTTTCDMANTSSNYSYYSSATVTTNVNAGTAYDLSVTTGADNIISVWIDYNRDGVYDASEWNQIVTTSTAGNPNMVSVLIPGTAFNGLTGMRIRSRASGSQNDATSACIDFFSGETEDYEITIENGVDAVSSVELVRPNIYPSPTAGIFHIDFGKHEATIKITVMDALGRTILNKHVTNSASELVNITGFTNGVYFVKVENEKGSSIQRIILNK